MQLQFGVIHLLDQEVIDKEFSLRADVIGGSGAERRCRQTEDRDEQCYCFMECQSLLSFGHANDCEVNARFPS